MKIGSIRLAVAVATLLLASVGLASPANAIFFFFLPIPNLAKPPELQKLIDALEKSKQTKAVAYVAENKTFAAKTWTWADVSGEMSQADADAEALRRCDANLQALKNKQAGGQPIYDFGKNTCQLFSFTHAEQPPPLRASKNSDVKPQSNGGEAWRADVSKAILEGRCEDAKAIALKANNLDVAEQALRLCKPH